MQSLLAATQPLEIGVLIVAGLSLAGTYLNYLGQRRITEAATRQKQIEAGVTERVAETNAEAALDAAFVNTWEKNFNALLEKFDKLQVNFDAEQQMRRALQQEVAELKVDLTQERGNTEQLRRDLSRIRAESEETIVAHHDHEVFLTNRIKFLEEECDRLNNECATLRIQIAEMQHPQGQEG